MNPHDPPTRGAPPTLDDAALARLRELDPDGRMGVVPRVLQTFDTSLARMLVQLRTELDAPQPGVVRAVAHQLKSSSASVGALDLSRACQEVEALLREGRDHDLTDAVHRLLLEGERARLAVAAMLHR
jgi:HPt (histidine-containing phosphotransfer) domain-containing protein